MRYKVFSIRDRAADVFGQPFFCANGAVAIRMFTDEVNRPDQNSNLYRHPEDFDLYYLGDFDDAAGEMIPEHPVQIAVGKDVSNTTKRAE